MNKNSIITNTLLRIDEVQGRPPAPFEQPRSDLTFWVLELPEVLFPRDHFSIQLKAIADRLGPHQKLIAELATRGMKPALYLQICGDPIIPLILPIELLRVVADFHGRIEICYEI